MKVDMKKLMEPEKPDSGMAKYRKLAKMAAGTAACLMLLGTFIFYRSVQDGESASADELYDRSQANPSFTVQHVAAMPSVDIGTGAGVFTVLTGDGEKRHAALDGDGTVKMELVRSPLYEPYETDWDSTGSIAAASFLNGEDGSAVEGYVLSEIWFGQDADSKNPSDFLILSVPERGGRADLSRVRLTNNPEHPGLSRAEGGYYVAGADNNYTVCVKDGDVVRLVFSPEEEWNTAGVNVFDYDVSDGGYYLSDDYFHKGDKKGTSGQEKESGPIYVDAMENGIHTDENYAGDGAKFAFGADGIGTPFSDAAMDTELDTINIWNYEQQDGTSGTGVAKGIVTGVTGDGNIAWRDNVSHPDLFGSGEALGKACYTDGSYSFTFRKNGFSRTLSAVESAYGTAAEGLESPGAGFWIADVAPSCGTDGHDPLWGDGSEKVQYFRDNDRAPLPFAVSDDRKIHNSFFGFSYTEDFVLQPGYAGTLDFLGYSDDDMWVFAGRVDNDGNVAADTVVPVIDLGGVHDSAAAYCNLWDVIDRVPYGEEAQDWRLFVFWLERDGALADCYMHFTLPGSTIMDEKEMGAVTVEAANFDSVTDDVRTFLFDDGTFDRYHGTRSDGKEITVVSGQEFSMPSGMLMTIEGIGMGNGFTMTETGKEQVWHSFGGGYEEGGTASGTVGGGSRISFLSADSSGKLSVTVDAEGTPDGGYQLELSIPGAGPSEISAMDGSNSPLGSRFTDGDGKMQLAMQAGETVVLYGVPEGTAFVLTPMASPGWHVAQITLDSGEADGASVSGQFPAQVVYRYAENEKVQPVISMEQSVSGDWNSSDIILGTGTLLSYKIILENPNDVPMDVTVEDILPDGLSVMGSSLGEGVLDGQKVTWDVAVDAGSVKELSFTCEVTAQGTQEFSNNAWIMDGSEAVASSNAVTASIP